MNQQQRSNAALGAAIDAAGAKYVTSVAVRKGVYSLVRLGVAPEEAARRVMTHVRLITLWAALLGPFFLFAAFQVVATTYMGIVGVIEILFDPWNGGMGSRDYTTTYYVYVAVSLVLSVGGVWMLLLVPHNITLHTYRGTKAVDGVSPINVLHTLGGWRLSEGYKASAVSKESDKWLPWLIVAGTVAIVSLPIIAVVAMHVMSSLVVS